jgi:hypothetical protein
MVQAPLDEIFVGAVGVPVNHHATFRKQTFHLVILTGLE